MNDLIAIALLPVGLVAGYYLQAILLKKKGLGQLIDAIKKKQTIAFLETDKAQYFRAIPKIYRNLGITTEKEIVILAGSAKPCMNLGGVSIVHGDLYKSITVPQEVRLFVNEMTAKEGWTEQEVAKFLEEIEQTPAEKLSGFYRLLKKGGNKDAEGKEITATPHEKRKYDIFIGLSSVVKNYIYTGINRTSIHMMLRELVYQRELEKGGGRNWVPIAIAVFVILIGVGFAVKFILGDPNVTASIAAATAAAPARVAP